MQIFLQQLVNGLAWGSIYGLIALGYTMVYGVLQLINFAHGDIYMIGAMAGFYLGGYAVSGTTSSLFQFILVMSGSMIICGLLGFLIERLAYRPLRAAPRLTALITAIGVSLFLQFGGQLVFGPDPKVFPEFFQTESLFRAGSVSLNNIQVIIFVVAILIALLLRFLVMNTRIGMAMRAVSFSHPASKLMGIPINRIISFTFVLGSMLAAIAGVLVGISNPKVDPLMGIMPGLKAFVAAVLGGIGNIPGALLGGLMIGVCESMVVGYFSSTYRDAIAFVILILVLLFRPQGLLGSKTVEKV
ncbi:MAG: ABC transporter permease [Deltaproteobacteria bacterium RIFCSPLOWO2_02_FULL_44_10]|nr:MAG: ABC transporter permease [Deltaproteobacteria bacterium RIFCSPHIGHO2_02_FULL_44_16]OGQ46327.1 MAG: ABC transporter permease [Deltaproteobacteria bacterium RIFCSPLOWO2_02_FULL_44_10]